MQDIRESISETDYKYYPIKYANKVFAIMASHNIPNTARLACWVDNVDKEKFLIGIGSFYDGEEQSSVLNIISVGF